MLDEIYCRDASASVGEQIEGSAATSTWSWLLVEHPGPWEPKAVPGLPPRLAVPLMAAESEIPGCRVQLIRRNGDPGESGPVLMWADSRPGRPWLRRKHLESLDALADLDLPGLFANPEAGEPVDRPTLIVCTHGKRDRCCAKYGLEVYRALAADPRVDVWQTTHLGGHRFAATLVELPSGLCYGRLTPDDAGPLLDAVVRGRMYRLDRFRGRTAFSRDVQAAEHAVRRRLGDMDPTSLSLIASAEQPGRTMVQFETVDGPLEVRVTAREGAPRPKSCHKDPTPVVRLGVR